MSDHSLCSLSDRLWLSEKKVFVLLSYVLGLLLSTGHFLKIVLSDFLKISVKKIGARRTGRHVEVIFLEKLFSTKKSVHFYINNSS
jgi:hypothetical protein